jgi:uncharacterized RDD family membrane protein YckC
MMLESNLYATLEHREGWWSQRAKALWLQVLLMSLASLIILIFVLFLRPNNPGRLVTSDQLLYATFFTKLHLRK